MSSEANKLTSPVVENSTNVLTLIESVCMDEQGRVKNSSRILVMLRGYSSSASK